MYVCGVCMCVRVWLSFLWVPWLIRIRELIYMCVMTHSHVCRLSATRWYHLSITRITSEKTRGVATISRRFQNDRSLLQKSPTKETFTCAPPECHEMISEGLSHPKRRMGWLQLVGAFKMIGLFCKRALWKRLYSAKETYNFKGPTNCSHPIWVR